MKVINKTPHAINIIDQNGQIIKTYEKTDGQIRLSVEIIESVPLIDGMKTTKTIFGRPEGLPEFEKDVYYIVSQMIKSALPERSDLLVPAEVVRDGKGVIIGCKSLGR